MVFAGNTWFWRREGMLVSRLCIQVSLSQMFQKQCCLSNSSKRKFVKKGCQDHFYLAPVL